MPIRIGLIGAGVMARDHAYAMVDVAGAQVVAVADPIAERAAEVASLHGAQAFADYHDLLDSVDAVWICTPPFLHREQAETCAAAGKHLFVEKPLALNTADCQAIIEAARAHRVKLTVGQVFHFYPIFQEAKRLIDAGTLGDLIMCWSKRVAALNADLLVPWRTIPHQGGGFCLEMQIHELDLIAWFGGDPVSICGRVTRNDPTFPAMDNSMSALITFANGCIGEVSGSWSARVPFSQRAIIGTRGTILMGDWAHMDHLRLTVEGKEEQVVPVADRTVAIRAEDEHFVRCIERDETPLVTGATGLRAVELALATVASSDRNATIMLPLT
jgi:predicted dehydrogenase